MSVSITCPLVRFGFWSFPLLLCEDQCVFWALEKFLLFLLLLLLVFFFFGVCPWNWIMAVQNSNFILVNFFFDDYKVCFPISYVYFGWKFILLDIKMTIPARFLRPFAWKFFCSPLIRGSFYLYCWSVIFLCRKMLDLVYLSSLYVCLLFSFYFFEGIESVSIKRY